jgi:hypothetical protein
MYWGRTFSALRNYHVVRQCMLVEAYAQDARDPNVIST